jgi:Fe2+ transport system protein FeoA
MIIIIIILNKQRNMQNLDSLQTGFKATIIGLADGIVEKHAKQLANLGLVKGNEVQVENHVCGLCLVKKENSVFGISDKLASKILVQAA